MDTHTRVVAVLYIVFGALTLIAAGIVFFSLGLAGGIVIAQGENETAGILGIVAVCVSGFLVLLALPDIIGGWALLTGREWGRVLVLILGFINLLNIPFGTALGVYTFWALLRDPKTASYNQVVPATTA